MRLLPATTAALLLLLAGLLLEPATSPVPAPRGLPLGHGADPGLTELLVEISDWIVTIGVGSNDLALSCSSFWCTRVPSTNHLRQWQPRPRAAGGPHRHWQ